jgi:hypothetical protein
MADKAKQDMIDNFIKITAVDQDRARFYLESSAWNLEVCTVLVSSVKFS